MKKDQGLPKDLKIQANLVRELRELDEDNSEIAKCFKIIGKLAPKNLDLLKDKVLEIFIEYREDQLEKALSKKEFSDESKEVRDASRTLVKALKKPVFRQILDLSSNDFETNSKLKDIIQKFDKKLRQLDLLAPKQKHSAPDKSRERVLIQSLNDALKGAAINVSKTRGSKNLSALKQLASIIAGRTIPESSIFSSISSNKLGQKKVQK